MFWLLSVYEVEGCLRPRTVPGWRGEPDENWFEVTSGSFLDREKYGDLAEAGRRKL